MSNSKSLSDHSWWQRWALGWIPFWFATYIVIKGAVLRPDEIPEVLLQINDKLFHFIQYFLLLFFAVNAFARAKPVWLHAHSKWSGWGYCLLVGVFTEFLQMNVPGRSSDLADWAADAGGATLALLILGGLSRRLSFAKPKDIG